jgi:hypothetical protein
MKYESIYHDISSGVLDRELRSIARYIKNRQSMLAHQAVQGLGVSSKASYRLNDTVNPGYLRGQKVEVVKINRTRVKVRLTSPHSYKGRFGTKVFNCPMNLLVKDEASA